MPENFIQTLELDQPVDLPGPLPKVPKWAIPAGIAGIAALFVLVTRRGGVGSDVGVPAARAPEFSSPDTGDELAPLPPLPAESLGGQPEPLPDLAPLPSLTGLEPLPPFAPLPSFESFPSLPYDAGGFGEAAPVEFPTERYTNLSRPASVIPAPAPRSTTPRRVTFRGLGRQLLEERNFPAYLRPGAERFGRTTIVEDRDQPRSVIRDLRNFGTRSGGFRSSRPTRSIPTLRPYQPPVYARVAPIRTIQRFRPTPRPYQPPVYARVPPAPRLPVSAFRPPVRQTTTRYASIAR